MNNYAVTATPNHDIPVEQTPPIVGHMTNTDACVQWSTDGTDSVFWGSGRVVDFLPSGLYRASISDRIGPHLVKQIISTDDLIELDDSESLKVIEEIERFWELKEQFTSRGLLHKRGILMSGDPGSGKTSTIQLLISKVIARNGIAIYPDGSPRVTAEVLQMVRRIERTKPICLILEDFEVLVQRGSNESEWLSILDGESQVDNIVFLASTNYISRLDKRFIDRPSRFDNIRFVTMPSRAMRKQYIVKLEPTISEDQLEEWLDHSDGMSIAHIKELIVSVNVFGYPLDHTLERLNAMRERKYDEEQNLAGTPHEKRSVGFMGVSKYR